MTTPRFRPPQQHRSRATLDRLLDAAEAVLEEKSFSDATLSEIVDRAGLTIGAFYRRFPDKDALLHHLDERFFAELLERATVLFEPQRWRNEPATEIIAELSREAVELYRSRRGLMRSLFIRARTDPVLQASARRVNAYIIDAARVALLDGRREIRHPDPVRAVEIGLMMFVGALRETVIFGEIWPRPTRDDPRLAAELARMFAGYLGLTGTRPGEK
jgi:AcrR family transcriptional regulator